MIPKKYNQEEAESKWYDEWEENEVYGFESSKENYIIDTPPPYPTGNFHVGNALNWCYIDFVARYKRMRGLDVSFPQGWDCHGLPTEVKVEEKRGVTKNEIPRDEFIKHCKELTTENIQKMKSTMKKLGFSIDWSQEYVTMEPSYWQKTQKSFIEMLEKDEIYKSKHPVNWCPRCETAIAYAEVEHEERKTKLNYIKFPVKNRKDIEIATTRPELLPACGAIAVNPADERYEDYVEEKAEVPLFGQEIEIIADEGVDPEFGTGAVMICTFGDKQDVEWWSKYDLKLRKTINEKGELTELAKEFEGLSIEEGKEKIIQRLKKEGFLEKQENIEQRVGLCWRCDTPIEILSENQWFVRVHQDEILDAAKEINWFPEHMYLRLKNWTEEMEWDWCISRQRIFGTPIPVWYCQSCGEVIVADKKDVPIDPRESKPPSTCGCEEPEIVPETDVLDTWMDSSISSLHHAGWPKKEFEEHYPVQIRPQGHDIIRTWAFYTILRSLALTDEKPWDTILINGMVFGEDGNKMSKSLGNIVSPEEVIEKEGVGPFRMWAATSGSPGNDIQFEWKDVEAGKKFLNKIWNVLRFTLMQTGEEVVEETNDFNLIDKWILTKLDQTISKYNEHMEKFEFQKSVRQLKSFLWNDLADNYLEMVKYRLYNKNDLAAKYALFSCVDAVIKMIAPFAPYFAEEAFSNYSESSIHEQNIPNPNFGEGEDAMKQGEVIKEIIEEVRRYKSDQGIALNTEIKRLEIYNAPSYLKENTETISNTVWADTLRISTESPEINRKPTEVSVDMSIIGPKYKDKAGEIAEKIKQMKPSELIGKEVVEIELDSSKEEIPKEAIEINEEPHLEGKEVEILDMENRDIKLVISRN